MSTKIPTPTPWYRLLLLLLVIVGTAGRSRAQTLDMCELGNSTSETAHAMTATSTEIFTGALGLPARRSLATNQTNGGDLLLTMVVDPVKRNYFSIKLWGDEFDGTDGSKGKLFLYVVNNGVNYQVGYKHEGDYGPLNGTSDKPSLPGRFFYATTMIPLPMSRGKTSLTLRVQNVGRIYGLGSSTNFIYPLTTKGRGMYRVYTHTSPMLDVTGETQGAVPATTARPQTPDESTLRPGGAFFNSLNNRVINRLSTTITATNYEPTDVQYLARSYSIPGLAGYRSERLVRKVVSALDFYTTQYYTNPSGSVNDWGGYFGPLGQAIVLLRPQLESLLNVQVTYLPGVTKTRRVAWADMLEASRDFGRLNRDSRAITNQGCGADENIYKANKGLLALGDSRALTEAQAQRYLLEAIGLRPWRGSDLSTAVNSGSSLKFGSSYTMVTQKGLSREFGYVGAAYGEMQVNACVYYRLTGNEEFKNQIINMSKARAQFRQPYQDPGSTAGTYYPGMRVEGLLAWRGSGECDMEFSTQIGYADRAAGGGPFQSAALTLDPTLVGYTKQSLLDGQAIANLSSIFVNETTTLEVLVDYDKVKNAPDSGIRIPMSDGQPDYAWADEENGILVIKHGSERLWISAYHQATGINGLARFHYSGATYDQYGAMETTPQFSYSGLNFTRPNFIDKQETNVQLATNPPTQAYAGEVLPMGASDLALVPASTANGSYGPFQGRVDFYAYRFGNYLVGLNVSQSKGATLRMPAGQSGTDLIAGGSFSGNVAIAPRTTRILYLPTNQDAAPIPNTPLLLTLSGTTSSQTTLTWTPSSGATSYSVKRSTTKGGPYTAVATGQTGLTYTDNALATGTNYYVVVGVNANGESYPSMEASTSGYANAAAPVINSALTASGAVGQPFAYGISGLNSPTSFGATGLPTGFSVNTGSGIITGTPTATGTFTMTITATNASGTDTETLVLTVAGAPAPVLNSPTTATGYVGTPFGYGITATNSPTGYAATGLPTGLSIDTSTGVVSGNPTAVGTYTFTVSATNSSGTVSQTVSLQVLAAGTPVITSGTALGGALNQALTYAIEATYGPTSFTATGLPTGLSLNASTGVISGSPTQSGTFIIDLGATNSAGTGTEELVLTILPGLPAPWVDQDVNLTATYAAGSATYNAGAFTQMGSGPDFGVTSDGFNYLYQTQTTANSGNVTLIARLTSRAGGASNNKVGIMLRETTVGGSKDVLLFLDGSNGTGRLGFRAATGGNRSYAGSSVASAFSSTVPLWFKLQRTGNVFDASISNDGTTYRTVGSTTVTMNSAIQLGMAISSRSTSLTTAVFDNVSVNGVAVGVTPQVQTITFNNLASAMVGDADINPAATATSGLRVIYNSSNPDVATIVNDRIHIVGAGSTSITAQQPGNDAYLAATAVSRTLNVTQDMTIAAGQTRSAEGSYRNVTVAGTLMLTAPLVLTGTLTIADGGVFDTNCQTVTGNGRITVAAGAELRVCHANGIGSSGAAGAIQLSGIRSFSPDASYTYTGAEAQQTGSGLPAQVRNLTVQNATGLTLTNDLAVAQVVRLIMGDLRLDGDKLTLLSSAAGTALVDNTGGAVLGTATVQRYIDPSLNAGLGYRHYSAPVSNTTVADLTTSTFTPVVNPTYNTAGGSASPFPTVFGYDETRLTAAAPGFDQGWYSPTDLTTSLAVGRGYTVNLSGSELVDFVGTLNNGPVSLSLSRGTPAEAGWQLLGNPYPAPLDWSTVTVPAGLDDAVYVYQSTSQYGGSYRSYVNGVGSTPLIPSSQGFLVRPNTAGATPTLVLSNANRVTTFGPQPAFNRTAQTRSLLQLHLSNAAGASDDAYVYFEAGATAGTDARHDALKLRNVGPAAVNLFSLAATQEMSINALPLLNQQTVVPLGVAVPQAGTYVLRAEQLLNLPNGVLLRDALTGSVVPLAQQPTYSFSVAAGASATGRFSLLFTAQVLGTAAASLSQQVVLFPNPARGEVQLGLPAALQAERLNLTILNTLGQTMRTVALAGNAGATRTVPLTDLATGVYTLRLETSAGVVNKRLVVE